MEAIKEEKKGSFWGCVAVHDIHPSHQVPAVSYRQETREVADQFGWRSKNRPGVASVCLAKSRILLLIP